MHPPIPLPPLLLVVVPVPVRHSARRVPAFRLASPRTFVWAFFVCSVLSLCPPHTMHPYNAPFPLVLSICCYTRPPPSRPFPRLSDFFAQVEADKKRVEAELVASAKQHDAEEGDDTMEKDDRKLKKPERMRLVERNKAEGNELFKDGNFEWAVQRYTKVTEGGKRGGRGAGCVVCAEAQRLLRCPRSGREGGCLGGRLRLPFGAPTLGCVCATGPWSLWSLL